LLILRVIAASLVALGFIVFAIQNASETVDLRFVASRTGDVHVLLVMFASFLSGFLVAMLLMSLRSFRLRRDVKRERRQVTALEHEIRDLRNAPVRELAP
jgi:uncharacterized integral membrane protein